ncbi:MAG: hypothetical protein QE271_01545 [Bacteriovoracaceae bacterium]|nr:hypothetical protein [Bacteriovoracaceae bacterium]
MHNFSLLYLFLFFSLPLLAYPEKVLITGFSKTIDDNLDNNSEVVGSLLRDLSNENIIYVYCASLPVSDESIGIIEQNKCLRDNQDARLILHLGEGECDIKFETIALNERNNNCPNIYISKYDETSTKIYSDDPDQINFSYDASKMYCLSQEVENLELNPSAPIRTSIKTEIGNYICDRVGFTQYHYLKKILKNNSIESGFIHIPKSRSLCYGSEQFNPNHLSREDFIKIQTENTAKILNDTITRYLKSEKAKPIKLDCPINSMNFKDSEIDHKKIKMFGKKIKEFDKEYTQELCRLDFSANAVENIFYQEKISIESFHYNNVNQARKCIKEIYHNDLPLPVDQYDKIILVNLEENLCIEGLDKDSFDNFILFIKYISNNDEMREINSQTVDFYKQAMNKTYGINDKSIPELEIMALIEFSKNNLDFHSCRKTFEDNVLKTSSLIKKFCEKKEKILNLIQSSDLEK